MSTTARKLGFLSLEFIVGEDTFWMTTGLGRDGYYFTQLPLSLFAGFPLHAQFISQEKDYSEITAYEGENLFCYSQDQGHDGPRKLATDLTKWPRLSWAEMAERLIDAIPLADQMGLWHNHIVRKTDPTLWINDVRYKVTAFLPPPGEGILAIYGEDYVPGTNPNWITCNLPDEASFKARLRQLKVEGLHINGQVYPVS